MLTHEGTRLRWQTSQRANSNNNRDNRPKYLQKLLQNNLLKNGARAPVVIATLLLFFSLRQPTIVSSPGSNPRDNPSARYWTRLKTEDRQRSASRTLVRRRMSQAQKRALRRPDVIYYPTPEETVVAMLRLANIKQGDVLYDLGSGDGRIPITAAQRYGIRAIGVEIDPKMVAVARERAQLANVSGLVSFRNADMFRTNIRDASVVTLYLSNRLNLLLRPRLLRELRPGTRIVSHDFHMGDWEPEQKIRVPWQGNLYRTIYLWTVPARPVKKKMTSGR
jgi:methylase of polypeptide subunit release factors